MSLGTSVRFEGKSNCSHCHSHCRLFPGAHLSVLVSLRTSFNYGMIHTRFCTGQVTVCSTLTLKQEELGVSLQIQSIKWYSLVTHINCSSVLPPANVALNSATVCS